MTIRLNKVTRDLNVGIATVVEFLQKKGHTVEANPNTKISEEQYAILVKEFSTDKNLDLNRSVSYRNVRIRNVIRHRYRLRASKSSPKNRSRKM